MLLPEFRNEPFTDFSVEANRNAFKSALDKVEARLPFKGENRIGARRVGAPASFESVNPCDASQVIGRFPQGTPEDAVAAIEAAEKAFATWSRVPAAERWELVLRIAKILRDRKHEFSAMMVLEESKSWAEADGDTAEAIDFCEFYAAGDGAPRAAAAPDALPGREERARVHSARRLRRHPALELPARDPRAA